MADQLSEMRRGDTVLREIRDGDTDSVLKWRNDPENMKYFCSSNPITAEGHLAFLEKYRVSEDEELYIIEHTGKAVGMIGLVGIDRQKSWAEWGRFVVAAEARGSGAAKTALYLICERVFRELGLKRLYCEVIADNPRAYRLYEKFGFQTQEIKRNSITNIDGPKDVACLELSREAWTANKEQVSRMLEG